MDIAPAFREQVSRYGNDRLALPCGGSALVLVYRRDAFESEANRAAAQQAGLTLEAADDLDAARCPGQVLPGPRLERRRQPDSRHRAGARGRTPEGVGDATFLARAASLGQHRDHFSFLFDSDDMTPRIDTPAVRRGPAGSGRAGRHAGPPGMERFDAAAARESFRTGKVAMLIDRAERAATWSHGKPVGVAPLPGSDRVFEPIRKEWMPARADECTRAICPTAAAGWSGSAAGSRARSSRRRSTSPSTWPAPRTPIASAPSGRFPCCRSAPARWGRACPTRPRPRTSTPGSGRTRSAGPCWPSESCPGLRIPGADGYLSDLAKGRVAAAGGEAPEKALEAVAKAWTERTKAAGPKRQLWHYRRSLNSLVTLPQPPEPGT